MHILNNIGETFGIIYTHGKTIFISHFDLFNRLLVDDRVISTLHSGVTKPFSWPEFLEFFGVQFTWISLMTVRAAAVFTDFVKHADYSNGLV